MIPTHSSEKTQRMGIVVNKLGLLNEYDFTEPHRHDYFEFFYFVKGGGVHTIDFKEYSIHDNSVHIVAPGQVHQVHRELDSEGYVVLFELTALNAPEEIESFLFEHICLDSEELKSTYQMIDNSSDDLHEKMETIYKKTKSGQKLDLLLRNNLLHGFCIACMSLRNENQIVIDNPYMQFRKLLKENYSTLKKVKDYAELMHISERSLNELAKSNSGKNASEIIYSQLIMESKRLIKTGISIKETAYALNFDDPAHFSKFFKSKTNMSPSEFQNCT